MQNNLIKALNVLIFLFLFNFCGLIPEESLKLSFLLNANIGELLLFVLGVLVLFYKIKTISYFFSKSIIIKILIVIILLLISRAIFNVLFDVSFEVVLRNIRRPLYYIWGLLILISIKDKKDVIFYIKLCYFMIFFGAISVSLYYFLGINLGDLRIETGVTDRIRHPIFQLALIVAMLNLSFLLYKIEEIPYRVVIPMLVISSILVLVSYFRTYYMLYIVISLSIIILSLFQSSSARIKVFFLIILFTILILSESSLFSGIEFYFERFLSTFDELSSNTGTFYIRFLIWIIRYNFVMEHNPLFGVGFIQTKDYLSSDINATILDPTNPSNDNGFAAIIVLLGFFGLAIFTFLYFNVIRTSLWIYKNSKDKFYKAFSSFSLSYFVFIFFSNFTLDNFIWVYALLPILIIYAIIIFIDDKIKRSDYEPSK